jgi:hypothetical protein
MRNPASLLLVALACALAAGCGKPGVGSGWNVMEEIEGAEKGAVVTTPRPVVQAPLAGLKDEDLPCLKTCHDREKWATGRPYPHLRDSHKGNGKRCVDCHAMGHRSAKSDRRICKECH